MAPVAINPASTFQVAIVGGGITGACVASVLRSASSIYRTSPPRLEPTSKLCRDGNWKGINIRIDLFDQGRSGVGGRSSHRQRTSNDIIDGSLRWDHGCQFFRADTELFQPVVSNWLENGIAKEWKGRFTSDDETTPELDFFGLPSQPPFYIGADGINTIPVQLLSEEAGVLNVFSGTRVARLERDESTKKWHLFGTSGQAAFHDTPEQVAQASSEVPLGQAYDAVILTDVSSSFQKWHRASAGVPDDFATRVQERVGARVPLFAAMIAFKEPLSVDMDAMSFHQNDILWFASRSTSKPLSTSVGKDCWTLISTPEYAMDKIEETPMQDPKTGAFIPQSKDYLTSIPGPDLEQAFRKAITSKFGPIELPETVYLDAQRWGSALPSHRHLDDTSPTRRVLSYVPYDSHRSPLAPTSLEIHDVEFDFLFDDCTLYQAGDMMSRYTPGYEGAAISGIQVAEHLLNTFIDRK